jgi:uncharacterized protein YndB with AHSA1/START domain
VSDQGSVRLVEVFDAPRERVFAAWTEEEELKRWWGPGPASGLHKLGAHLQTEGEAT